MKVLKDSEKREIKGGHNTFTWKGYRQFTGSKGIMSDHIKVTSFIA